MESNLLTNGFRNQTYQLKPSHAPLANTNRNIRPPNNISCIQFLMKLHHTRINGFFINLIFKFKLADSLLVTLKQG